MLQSYKLFHTGRSLHYMEPHSIQCPNRAVHFSKAPCAWGCLTTRNILQDWSHSLADALCCFYWAQRWTIGTYHKWGGKTKRKGRVCMIWKYIPITCIFIESLLFIILCICIFILFILLYVWKFNKIFALKRKKSTDPLKLWPQPHKLLCIGRSHHSCGVSLISLRLHADIGIHLHKADCIIVALVLHQ